MLIATKINVFAQQCDAYLIAIDIFKTQTKSEQVTNNSYTCQLSKMSDEKFKVMCELFEHNPNFKAAKQKKSNMSNYLMYAENFNGGMNFFSHNLSYQKEIDNLPKDAQERLKVIGNTINLLENLRNALEIEKSINVDEISINAVNLELKLVFQKLKGIEIKGIINIDEYVTNMIGKELATYTNDKFVNDVVRKREPIENWLADGMNEYFKLVERAAIFYPPLRAATMHPYYLTFSMLPEIGKMIGHAGGYINIYFRQNEYTKQIKVLEREREYILKNKQLGPVIKSD